MIGERLAELRKDRDWDQRELANQLQVSYHTISSYERNISQPNHEMLIKIAKLFDISADYLLGLIRERASYRRDEYALVLNRSLSQEQIDQIKQFIAFVERQADAESPSR
ncbi:helix-turn-helix transcriptional regulator [Oscillospiraceae bacterium MB08-C2-2]|nr:helix-turn-helix transcriptional regulator [Oscillospiraceae bacterium MB08-C2-2]